MRRIQFRLRTLLVITVLVSLVLGFYAHAWRQIANEASVVEKLKKAGVVERFTTQGIDNTYVDTLAGKLAYAINSPVRWAASANDQSVYSTVVLIGDPNEEQRKLLRKLRYLNEVTLKVDDADDCRDLMLSFTRLREIKCQTRKLSKATFLAWTNRGVEVTHVGFKEYSLKKNFLRYDGFDYEVDPEGSSGSLSINRLTDSLGFSFRISVTDKYVVPGSQSEYGWYDGWDLRSNSFREQMTMTDWQLGESFTFDESDDSTTEISAGNKFVELPAGSIEATRISKNQIHLVGTFGVNCEIDAIVDVRTIDLKSQIPICAYKSYFGHILDKAWFPEIVDNAREKLDKHFDMDVFSAHFDKHSQTTSFSR